MLVAWRLSGSSSVDRASGDLRQALSTIAYSVPQTRHRIRMFDRQMMLDDVDAHIADARSTRPRPQFTCAKLERPGVDLMEPLVVTEKSIRSRVRSWSRTDSPGPLPLRPSAGVLPVIYWSGATFVRRGAARSREMDVDGVRLPSDRTGDGAFLWVATIRPADGQKFLPVYR